MKRIALVREAATGTIAGLEKFAVQAARRVVRLQERRKKLRRELKAVDNELRIAKKQLRGVVRGSTDAALLDTPMPAAATAPRAAAVEHDDV
jgi:hypothetical protein